MDTVKRQWEIRNKNTGEKIYTGGYGPIKPYHPQLVKEPSLFNETYAPSHEEAVIKLKDRFPYLDWENLQVLEKEITFHVGETFMGFNMWD